jgi:hypothetical protein
VEIALRDSDLHHSLFAWLISHQPAVFFSHNKPATSNQPTVLFSQNKPAPAISHQPNEQAVSFAHLLPPMYLAHDTATTSGTRLSVRPTIALALTTFFTSSRHVLSAFSVCILATKWLRKGNQQTMSETSVPIRCSQF